MVVRAASEVDLPNAIKSKMMFNVILDFLVGLVPILGDLADAAYKANTRNAIILENYLRERGAENIKRQGQAPPPDMSLPAEYEQQPGLEDTPPGTSNGAQRQVVRGGADQADLERHAMPPPPPPPPPQSKTSKTSKTQSKSKFNR